MKKIIILIGILYIFCIGDIYAEINTKDFMDVNVTSAIVIDQDTKRVLFESNAYEQVAIASLTKMMTCILLVENCDLNEVVIAADGVDWIGGSSLGLSAGDSVTVENLLVGMLLPSGNDAAYASAIHLGLTMENFANMMNEKAKEIGCLNTNFVNSYGLDADGHLSTAYDMALIMSYAYDNEIIREIISRPTSTVNYGNTTKTVTNTNRLLTTNEYCTGGKTGYTDNANRCLATTATKDDFSIITIVLGAPDTDTRFNTADELMYKTFELYQQYDLSSYTEFSFNVSLTKATQLTYSDSLKYDITYPLIESELEEIVVTKRLVKSLEAPVEGNTFVANITVNLGEEVLLNENVYTNYTIEKKQLKDYVQEILQTPFG